MHACHMQNEAHLGPNLKLLCQDLELLRRVADNVLKCKVMVCNLLLNENNPCQKKTAEAGQSISGVMSRGEQAKILCEIPH